MSNGAIENEELAVTNDSEPGEQYAADDSEDDVIYPAENSIQIADEEVLSNQQASDNQALHADGNDSPQVEYTSDAKVAADEDQVQHDIHEVGDPTTVTPQPYLSGEIDVADNDGLDSHESGQAELPTVSDSSDNADQQTRTPQMHLNGTPVEPTEEEDAGISSSNAGGEAEPEVEQYRSGTSKSSDSVRAEVQFDDDQVLLERDGKFRVVNTDDVMADEDDIRSRSSSTSSDAALRVSSMSAKTSSGGTRGRMSSQRSAAQPPVPRSKSAVAVPALRRRSVDYNTTHRLTDDQKRQLERQQASKAERARQEEEEQREKEERKRQECDDAFQAWLRRKRVEAAQRRRERIQELREEREKNNKTKEEAKSAFEEWLKVKKEQQKQEAKNEQEREKEVQTETKKRSKKEAERAFKKWLRKKHREARLQAKMSQNSSQNSRKNQKATQTKSATVEAR